MVTVRDEDGAVGEGPLAVSNVTYLERVTRKMVCTACEYEAFTLHEDGTIRCAGCCGRVGGTQWVRSTPPHSAEETAASESCPE